MRDLIIAVSLVVTALPSARADEVTSSYTTYDVETDCETASEVHESRLIFCRDQEGRNRSVYIQQSEVTSRIVPGYISLDWMERSVEFFKDPHGVHDTIEWRIRHRQPFATIHRVFIESPSRDNEVLVVSRVGPYEGDGMGCIIALIDARANENANQLAREIADQFYNPYKVDCLTFEPAYHGKVSDELELPAKIVR